MPTLSPWLLVPLAAVPGLLAVRSGRALLRHLGDPLFPERAWAHRRGATIAFVATGVCGGLLLALSHASAAVWLAAATVLVGGNLAADFHIRRPLFEESWSFGTYAAFQLRVLTALGGFWFGLIVTPSIVLSAGTAAPLAAILCAALLILWNRYYARITPLLVGAREVTSRELLDDLESLLARTSLARPMLYCAGPPGGVFANAFALPSLRTSAVLVFNTLLERCSRSEVQAILAHELAHLEQFDRRVLTRHTREIIAMVIASATLVPYVLARSELAVAGHAVWGLVVLFFVAYLSRGHQERETAGDLRAAELIGDPETLASALQRLHAIGHLPRRWDTAVEARASHPALARRLQALRAQGRTPAAPASEDFAPVVIATRTPGEFLVFEQDRVRCVQQVPEGVPHDVVSLVQHAARVVTQRYDEVASVHVVPLAAGADVVVQSSSRTLLRAAVSADQIPAVQAVLDRVDGRFNARPATTGQRPPLVWTALMMAVIGLVASGAALILPAIIAAAVRTPRAAAMLAAGGGTVALLLVGGDRGVTVLVLMSALTAMAAWGAIGWRTTSAEPAHSSAASWLLLAWTALAIACLGAAGLDAFHLSRVAASFPSAMVAPVSAAAWLLFGPRRQRLVQWGALALLVITLAVAALGTTWFVDRISEDALLATRVAVSAPAMQGVDATLTPVGDGIAVSVRGDVRIAADGRRYAVRKWCDSYDDPRNHCRRRDVIVGNTLTGARATMAATDIHFLRDTLVVLATDRDDAVLTQQDADGETRWSVVIPSGEVDTLVLDDATNAWMASGDSPDGRLVFHGRIGDPDVSRLEWDTESFEGSYLEWFVDGRFVLHGLATQYGFETNPFQQVARSFVLPFVESRRERVSLVAGRDGALVTIAESSLGARCFDGLSAAGVICFADDGRRTHVWRFDAAAGRIEPIGWSEGTQWEHAPPDRDRWLASSFGVCGWRVMDVARAEVTRLPFSGETCPYAAALAGRHIAALANAGDQASELRVYELAH